MITPTAFANIIRKFGHCCDRPVRTDQVNELYDRLKFEDEGVLTAAIEDLIMQESKLTLPAIKHAIASSKKGAGEVKTGSHWSGKECNACDMGLIHTIKRINSSNYTFVYRCGKCRSYDAPIIPFYNGDNIDETRIPIGA